MVGEYLSRALEDVRAGIKEEGEVVGGAAHNPKPRRRIGVDRVRSIPLRGTNLGESEDDR